MLHNKKIVFIVIGTILLIGIVLTIYFVVQSKPQNVIESKLNLDLPSPCKIINYEYHSDGGFFYAKISIDKQNADDIKQQLDNFFGGVTVSTTRPEFKNSCSWWDMDEQNVESRYMSYIDIRKWRKIMPHQVWAFISKDKEGRYYLYISY